MSILLNNVKLIAKKLESAEKILIGAGAGLSAAAGIDFSDKKTFAKLFPPLLKKGLSMQYELIGYKNWTPEEKWAYYAVHVNHVRFQFPPSEMYRTLFDLVKNKDYFVITSNADGMFLKTGFAEDRVFTPQGRYDLVQCLKPCTNQTWDSKPIIDNLLLNIDYEKLTLKDSALVPKCPNCGGPMFLNVRGGDWFVEEPHAVLQNKFHEWVDNCFDKKLVLFEFGVGFNTPGVIRWPFEKITEAHSDATLVRVNRDYPFIQTDIKDKAIITTEDADKIIFSLSELRARELKHEIK